MAYEAIDPKGGDTSTPLSLKKRLAFFAKHHVPFANQRIIDCGCGEGRYVVEFLKRDADAYGVEYDGDKVARAQQRYPDMAHRISQGNIELMNFPDATF